MNETMSTLTSPERTGVGFDDRGRGEPALLYVPGWCGNRTVFDDLARRTSEGRRSLTMDLPEHGDRPRTGSDFDYDDVLDLAVGLLEDSGVDHVVPVTLSHAGWAAIELRNRWGADRVPGMIWVDWMPLGAPPPFRQALAGLQDPQAWAGVRAKLFEMWTSGIDVPALHEVVAGMGCYDGTYWQRAGRNIAGAFEAYGSPVAAVDALGTPTLHLYAQPADDGFLSAQRDYAAAHPWFEVQRLTAQSHFPMLEVPAEMAESIEEFVCRLG